MRRHKFEIFLILTLGTVISSLVYEATLKEEPYIKKKPIQSWDTTSVPTWKDEDNLKEINNKYNL